MRKINFKASENFLSWAILIFLACIWGLSFLFIKKIVVVLSPVELGGGRVFFAAIFLLPWVFKGLKSVPKEKLSWLFLVGLLGNLIPAFIFGLVGSKLNSSLAGTLNSTTPIFVLIIGAAFFAAKIKKFQILGLSLGFIGSLFLVMSGNGGGLNMINPYAILAICATMMYAFNVNIISKYLNEVSPLHLTAIAFFFVGILAFIILLFTDFFTKITLLENRRTLYYLLFLAGINTSLALVIFNYLLQISSPVFASSVTYLIPIVAMIAGALDGEIILFWHYIGIGIILMGVFLINRKRVTFEGQVFGKRKKNK